MGRKPATEWTLFTSDSRGRGDCGEHHDNRVVGVVSEADFLTRVPEQRSVPRTDLNQDF
jgi:hypothetical protein